MSTSIKHMFTMMSHILNSFESKKVAIFFCSTHLAQHTINLIFSIIWNKERNNGCYIITSSTKLTYCTSQIGLNDLALQGSSTQWKSNDSQIAPQFESRPLFGWPEPQSVNSAVISSGYSFQISSRTSSVRPIQCLGAI